MIWSMLGENSQRPPGKKMRLKRNTWFVYAMGLEQIGLRFLAGHQNSPPDRQPLHLTVDKRDVVTTGC